MENKLLETLMTPASGTDEYAGEETIILYIGAIASACGGFSLSKLPDVAIDKYLIRTTFSVPYALLNLGFTRTYAESFYLLSKIVWNKENQENNNLLPQGYLYLRGPGNRLYLLYFILTSKWS